MYITVLKMQRLQTNQQLEIMMSIGNQKKNYSVEVSDINGITCVSVDREFKEYLMKNGDKNKIFTKLVMDFYEDKPINFPVELGEFKI